MVFHRSTPWTGLKVFGLLRPTPRLSKHCAGRSTSCIYKSELK
ncbi:hypothetical protein PAMC26577_28135 [Caballeronia sordidicola]|uniref:Uncharacterized protein n=1 Tax=Caballeronia sordidicola TaxID=196367 RepID=A0A242MGA9_CABSO|nr:hypothetical protein PAMC26577_28135 [Caballeronia sordidicola]